MAVVVWMKLSIQGSVIIISPPTFPKIAAPIQTMMGRGSRVRGTTAMIVIEQRKNAKQSSSEGNFPYTSGALIGPIKKGVRTTRAAAAAGPGRARRAKWDMRVVMAG